MNLEILPVKNLDKKDEKNVRKLHDNLIKPPFLGILNGSVRAGKSTFIMNLLYNPSFYKDTFDKIFFISPTCMNDDTLRHLREDEEIIKICDDLEYMDTILEGIVNIQKEEGDKKKDILIILDDCLGFIKPKSYLSHLCTRYRHYKISILIASQGFRSIPNICRVNATFYILFSSPNKKEVMKMEEEFGSIIPNWKELYEEATDKPYNFMFLDLSKIKAFHNFMTLLYTKIK